MTGDKRVLVVDDEPDFADAVVRVARSMGYVAYAAANAADCRRLYLAMSPDIVVLDIVMPGEDGIELIQWLVAQACRAHIVIASGYNPEYAKCAQALAEVGGRLDVTTLRKPVKLEELRAALR